MRRLAAVLLALSLAVICIPSCSSKTVETSSDKTTDIYKFLGGYDYDSSLVAFVYEPVEGEEEAGIQYRKVNDIDGLLKSGVTVLIYFTSSMATDLDGVTAGVEDIAQCTWGSLVVIKTDVLEDRDLSTRYGIEKVPEFVLVKSSDEISRFEGYNYDIWRMEDVADWVSSNGINVDRSKLG